MVEQKYTINNEILCHVDDSGAIILNLENGIYYSLNRTASDIFNILKTPKSHTDIKNYIKTRFEEINSDINTDINDILSDLLKEKIIVLSNA